MILTASQYKQEIISGIKGMEWPLTLSGLCHLGFLLLMIWGLPHIKSDLPVIENAVTIEIVELDEKTETDKIPQQSKPKPVPKPPQVKKKPTPPPTVKSEQPPRPIKPTPPELAEKIDPADISALKKEDIQTVNKTEKAPDEKFLSLLRNLEEHEPETKETTKEETAIEKPQRFIPLGERMTMSEQQAVLQRLGECWNIMAGARYAEELVVKMTIYMNADRTVRNARITDQLRYNTDSYFRAAADSALRALGHPSCQVLPLPPDKYEQWKEFKVTFDPREMLQ